MEGKVAWRSRNPAWLSALEGPLTCSRGCLCGRDVVWRRTRATIQLSRAAQILCLCARALPGRRGYKCFAHLGVEAAPCRRLARGRTAWAGVCVPCSVRGRASAARVWSRTTLACSCMHRHLQQVGTPPPQAHTRTCICLLCCSSTTASRFRRLRLYFLLFSSSSMMSVSCTILRHVSGWISRSSRARMASPPPRWQPGALHSCTPSQRSTTPRARAWGVHGGVHARTRACSHPPSHQHR